MTGDLYPYRFQREPFLASIGVLSIWLRGHANLSGFPSRTLAIKASCLHNHDGHSFLTNDLECVT